MPHPETLIVLGSGLGLAVGEGVLRVVRSEWGLRKAAVWRFRWVTRPSRLRQVRRTTREALASANARKPGRPSTGTTECGVPQAEIHRAVPRIPAEGVTW